MTWKSLTEDLSINLIDRLPHLLSWLMLEIDEDIHLAIDEGQLIGSIGGKPLSINFVKSNTQGVFINDIWYAHYVPQKLQRIKGIHVKRPCMKGLFYDTM